MCLVNDKLLSKITPRFRADADGEIMLPQRLLMKTESYFVAEGCHYEEFSLWWIDWKAIGGEPDINLIKDGGKQGETVMRLLGENEM